VSTIARVELNPLDPLSGLPTGDIDVTERVIEGAFTRRLNGIGTAGVRLNMKGLGAGVGSYLKIYLENPVLGTTPVLFHHGRILLTETTASEDTGYTVFNSSDPLELWQARPVRDDDGDFSKPSIIETYQYGTQIIEAMVNNSESAGGGPPSDAEGPTRLRIGTVEAGVTTLVGAPTDWPMTMAELAQLLISTNTVDVVVTPIEFFGPNDDYGELTLVNGDYGTDLSSSVAFQYGMGAENVRSLRWNEDMTGMCNKLWYYLGPRVETPEDPPGDQHWRANVQGDDPFLAYPPGGALSPPASPLANIIGTRDYFSRQTWDVRMDIRIYDGRGDEAIVGRDLYRRLWQEEQYLRAYPRTIVHVTPARDVGFGEFDIGDLVLVEASSEVNGGFSGAQRVYAYTGSWTADDSVIELGELQVSSDQEGFT
jgi:hypothetical protein